MKTEHVPLDATLPNKEDPPKYDISNQTQNTVGASGQRPVEDDFEALINRFAELKKR